MLPELLPSAQVWRQIALNPPILGDLGGKCRIFDTSETSSQLKFYLNSDNLNPNNQYSMSLTIFGKTQST